jgi:hypothetical protein
MRDLYFPCPSIPMFMEEDMRLSKCSREELLLFLFSF